MIVTPKQKEILRHLSNGVLQKQIGDHLGISVKTVENHLRQLKQRNQCKTPTHLVAMALRQGVLK